MSRLKYHRRGKRPLSPGDGIHHPCQIARPDWFTIADSNQQGSCDTRAKMLRELAGTDTLLLSTQFAEPTAGKVVADGDTYRLI